MHPLRVLRDERGIALITVLLVSMVIAGIAVGAALVSTNVALINRYHDRQSLLASAADAGLEQARSLVNGNKSLYPASGFTTLENGALVTDASGTVIPGLKRYLYVGPTGVTSGQYGVFGSIVSIVKDAQGDQVVRREEVVQESFAKFAYFTDVEPSTIAFGNGDAIYGPVHTNDTLRIYSSGATFYGPVETSKAINGKPYGTFKQGYTENAVAVPMPTSVDLTKLKTQAQAGNLALVSGTSGKTQTTLRIEFVAIDLNIPADGNVTDANEGFVRVYQAINPGDVVVTTGSRPNNSGGQGLAASENCGDYHGTTFVAAKKHPAGTPPHDYVTALTSASRRCYLGGSDSLFGTFQNEQATDAHGAWQKWPGPAVNNPVVQGRADGAYLWRISRAFNPTFKSVIYVAGDVVVSGVVRGQVTLAASGNIIIGDDIIYATNPAAGTCNDILGLFAGLNVVIDRKSTRLNSSHSRASRMPSSA